MRNKETGDQSDYHTAAERWSPDAGSGNNLKAEALTLVCFTLFIFNIYFFIGCIGRVLVEACGI